jgi:diaminohydroxyphosphoribosylaminopyrimidine deaminase/5-amino-6-(5-phosphoribosylamino)uracil reductase
VNDRAEVDRRLMARALELARRGLYSTSPNPRVGCVVACDGEVVGEGWHERAGGAHAEVAALADARGRGRDPAGATLYVTLEPCNHTGRTPPCTDAVIGAGIRRVVAAMADPNPVAAHGATRLRAAGIAVDFGVLEEEARELNIGWLWRLAHGRPWVRLKIATSLDGRSALADGSSRWITGDAARDDGHRFRARACAILTGIGTVRSDDPALTVRAVPTPRQPLRVVVDRNAETPPQARVLAGATALVVTAGARNAAWPEGVEAIALPDAAGRVDLAALVAELARRGVNELHVEAGAGLNGALFAAGLVDEVVAYVAPLVLGDPARGVAAFGDGLRQLADGVRLRFHDVARIGDDLRVTARVLRED